jgi:hypothetical protein
VAHPKARPCSILWHSRTFKALEWTCLAAAAAAALLLEVPRHQVLHSMIRGPRARLRRHPCYNGGAGSCPPGKEGGGGRGGAPLYGARRTLSSAGLSQSLISISVMVNLDPGMRPEPTEQRAQLPRTDVDGCGTSAEIAHRQGRHAWYALQEKRSTCWRVIVVIILRHNLRRARLHFRIYLALATAATRRLRGLGGRREHHPVRAGVRHPGRARLYVRVRCALAHPEARDRSDRYV